MEASEREGFEKVRENGENDGVGIDGDRLRLLRENEGKDQDAPAEKTRDAVADAMATAAADTSSPPPPNTEDTLLEGNDTNATAAEGGCVMVAAVRQRRDAVRAKQERERQQRLAREAEWQEGRQHRRTGAAPKRALDAQTADWRRGRQQRQRRLGTDRRGIASADEWETGAGQRFSLPDDAHHRGQYDRQLIPLEPPFGTEAFHAYEIERHDRLLRSIDREMAPEQAHLERLRWARALRARPAEWRPLVHGAASRETAASFGCELGGISLALPLAPPTCLDDYWFQMRLLEWRRLSRLAASAREVCLRENQIRTEHAHLCRLIDDECDVARRHVIHSYLAANAAQQWEVERRLWNLASRKTDEVANGKGSAVGAAGSGSGSLFGVASASATALIRNGKTREWGARRGRRGRLPRSAVAFGTTSIGGSEAGSVPDDVSAAHTERGSGNDTHAGALRNGVETDRGGGVDDGVLFPITSPGVLLSGGVPMATSHWMTDLSAGDRPWTRNGALAELARVRSVSVSEWSESVLDVRPRVRIPLEAGEIQRDLRMITGGVRAAHRARAKRAASSGDA
eukprot:ctg_93.g27